MVEKKVQKIFSSCLDSNSTNDIEYETVLKCKGKAFMEYIELSLDSQEASILEALKKYA